MLLRPALSENAMGLSGTGRSAGSEVPYSNRIGVLPPGVYVAMNGRAPLWDKVRQNRNTGVEPILRAPIPRS